MEWLKNDQELNFYKSLEIDNIKFGIAAIYTLSFGQNKQLKVL